jgi:predicted dienelactone hydrolase
VRHARDNWQDRSLVTSGRYLSERPQQLTRVLDALLASPEWGARIPAGRIGAVGHSAGGYSVLALAGAQADPQRSAQHCRGVQDDPGYCSLAKGQAATESSVMQAAPGASASAPQARIVSVPDRRIGAVVALAPMAVVFTPESLAAITVPVRVIMAEPDACRPATGPAGRRARLRAERHPEPSPRFGARRTAANHHLAALRQGLNEPAPGARHRTAPWHGFC